MATAAMETASMMTGVVAPVFYQQAITLSQYPIIRLP